MANQMKAPEKFPAFTIEYGTEGTGIIVSTPGGYAWGFGDLTSALAFISERLGK